MNKDTLSATTIWRTPSLWLLLTTMACVLIYWPGLSGPFIFDDDQNMRILKSWSDGKIGLQDLATGNGSILFHRSLAMLSLALNLIIGGESSFSFKMGNLLMHLAIGWVAFGTFSHLLRQDKNLNTHAKATAACICMVWLILPINVSTVLYVIQRMSQIATLFPLLGVWLYAMVRKRMLAGKLPESLGSTILLAGIGGLTFLGIQGKQSAAVLPGLCLVVELGWFQIPRQWSQAIKIFYGLSIFLPALAVASILIWKWSWLEAGMLEWGMTPVERLMSEPRALWKYIYTIFIPYAPSMGIYTDDFEVSRSWLHPATTIPSALGLTALSVIAWRTRFTRPAFFVGWFWFLVAHSIEATIVPIELYYEHRNYLPAFGLLLMVSDFAVVCSNRLNQLGVNLKKFSSILLVALVAALSMQTGLMASQWRSLYGIALTGIQAHPDSARAYIDYGRASIQVGRPSDAYAAYMHMASNPNPAIASIGRVELTLLNCNFVGDSDPALLKLAAEQSPERLNYVIQYAISDLVGMRASKDCGRISAQLLADVIVTIVDKASNQPEGSQSKWSMRNNAAMSYYQAGDWENALKQADIAWQHSPDPTIALFYVKLLLHNGQYEKSTEVFWQIMDRAEYSKIQEIYTGTRGVALRAVKNEIDSYAKINGMTYLKDTTRAARP